MSEKTKNWLKDNFIGLLLVAMVGAYFTYDLKSKGENRQDHVAIQQENQSQSIKLQALILIQLKAPYLNEYDKAVLLDFIKSDTRGIKR